MLKQLALRARRHDIGLNIDAEEADRLELSLDLLERLCFEPELAGWNGIGFVVQAYQKRCPFVVDFLVDLARRSRPSADGSAGQGRVLGQRDQACPGRRPRRLSGLHAKGLHRRRLPRLRAHACSRRRPRSIPSSRPTTRTRWRRSTSSPAPRVHARAVRVPVPARHGRAALRAGRRQRRRRQARPAVPHLRAGRHARDAARVPRAAPARERRQHLVRQPHRRSRRRRSRRWSRTRCERSSAWPRAKARRSACRIPRSSCRARSTARRGSTRAASISPTKTSSPRSPMRSAGDAATWSAAPLLAGTATRRRGDAGAQSRPTIADVVGQVQDASLADVATALASAAAAAAVPGPRPTRARARRCSSAPPTCSRPTSRACSGCSRARPARPIRTRSPKCARRSTSCASTPPRRGAISPSRRTCRSGRSSASARGTSRSRSSPARSPPRWSPAIRCWPSRPSRRR